MYVYGVLSFALGLYDVFHEFNSHEVKPLRAKYDRWWLEKRQGKVPGPDCIDSLSCVFRAGRQGADTDHSSILFDVDASTGTILKGTTNAHWYELGPTKMFNTPWVSTHDATHHPDNNK